MGAMTGPPPIPLLRIADPVRGMPGFRVVTQTLAQQAAVVAFLDRYVQASPTNLAALRHYAARGSTLWEIRIANDIDGPGGYFAFFQPGGGDGTRLADGSLPDFGDVDAIFRVDAADFAGLESSDPFVVAMFEIKLAVYLSHEVNHSFMGRHAWGAGFPATVADVIADPIYRAMFAEWHGMVFGQVNGRALRWWFGDGQGEVADWPAYAAVVYRALTNVQAAGESVRAVAPEVA
jgi:hypothetical protein